jgi:hypothetical protein
MSLVDFKSTFDSIRRGESYEVRLGMGIPVKVIKLVRMATDNSSAKVKVGNKLMKPFQFNVGKKKEDGLCIIQFHNGINRTDEKGTLRLNLARSLLTQVT